MGYHRRCDIFLSMKRKHVLTHTAIIIAVIVAAVLGGCYSIQTLPEQVNYKTYAEFTDFTDKVLSVDISPDGRYLAAGSMDNTVKIYDLKNRSLVREFERHPDDIFTLAFGPNSEYLATGCRDRLIRVFVVETGELVYTLDRHNDTIYKVRFHPDGRFLASAGKDKTIFVWDLDTGTLANVLREHKDAVYALEFSPDGESLYSGSLDKTVVAWNVESLSMTASFKAKQDVYSLAVNPANTFVAVSGVTRERGGAVDKRISPINVYSINDDYKRQKVFSGHQKACWAIIFTPDGQYLVSGGTDSRIRIWTMAPASQKMVGSFDSQADEVWDLAMSPDGSFLAAACSDNAVMVYRK